jgi:2'-5' RNA ligase
VRLFVAVTPDDTSRAKIAALRAALEHVVGDAAEALRWVGPAEAHITLHFLGEVDASRTALIAAAIGDRVDQAPFVVTLGAPSASPRHGPPRVVWQSVVHGEERLKALQAEIGRRLASTGLALDARPFAPHLTLARVRERQRRQARDLGVRLQRLSSPPISWRVGRVELYESDLSAGPPRYRVLHAITLADPSAD